MLTDHQKHLIKATFQSLFFDNIEELPPEVQIEACRAVKSLPHYLTVIEIFKNYDIEGTVREAGEILNHPASQNPCGHGVDLDTVISSDSVTVLIEYKEGVLKSGRKGIFNIIAHDDQDSPSSSKEISIFIKQLIDEKLEKLTGNKEFFPAVVTQTISEKILSEFDPDTFLNNSIESQLGYLGITSRSAKFCDKNNFSCYQLFLSQFKISKQSCDTIEKINMEFSKWYKRCIDELKETENYTMIDNHNLCLVDIVEAKLSRFNHYLTSPDANFYVYRALKRIAFANGDFSMESSLEPDYLDMLDLLIKFKAEEFQDNNQKIQEILNMQGKHFHRYNGNFLLKKYLNSNMVNTKTLEILIENISVDVRLIDEIFGQLSQKKTEYSYHVSKALLRKQNYKKLLSKEIAQEMFIEAVIRDDFECQMLVLAQSPDEFSSKLLLNKESLIKLVENEFYNSAKKIIRQLFPSKLSTEDIGLMTRLSNGMIKFQTIRYPDPEIIWANPAPLVPQYALIRAASQQPVPASPAQLDVPSQSSSSMSPH